MKTVKANKNLEEVFSEALRLGEDLTIKCKDGKFVLKSNALLKIKDNKIFGWNGKSWDNLTE